MLQPHKLYALVYLSHTSLKTQEQACVERAVHSPRQPRADFDPQDLDISIVGAIS